MIRSQILKRAKIEQLLLFIIFENLFFFYFFIAQEYVKQIIIYKKKIILAKLKLLIKVLFKQIDEYIKFRV